MTKRHLNYSSELDHKAEFEAMSEKEQELKIMNPAGVDEGKWEKAKAISKETYGELRYPFIMWLTKEKL